MGGAFACALLDTPQAKCWGDNRAMQLGAPIAGAGVRRRSERDGRLPRPRRCRAVGARCAARRRARARVRHPGHRRRALLGRQRLWPARGGRWERALGVLPTRPASSISAERRDGDARPCRGRSARPCALSLALAACGVVGHAAPDGGDALGDGDGARRSGRRGRRRRGHGHRRRHAVRNRWRAGTEDGTCDILEAVAAAQTGQSVTNAPTRKARRASSLNRGALYPIGKTLRFSGGTEIGLADGATGSATIAAAPGLPSIPATRVRLSRPRRRRQADVWLRDVDPDASSEPAALGGMHQRRRPRPAPCRVTGFSAGGLVATCLPASGCDHKADTGRATTLHVLGSSSTATDSAGTAAESLPRVRARRYSSRTRRS